MARVSLLIVSLVCLAGAGCMRTSGARENYYWDNLEAEAVFDRGEAYYDQEIYNRAIAEYRRYLDRYPDLYHADDAGFRIAQCLEKMGERVEAADTYRAAGEMYNHSSLAPAAFLRAGDLYEMEGYRTAAGSCYGRVLRDYPRTEEAEAAQSRIDAIAEAEAEEATAETGSSGGEEGRGPSAMNRTGGTAAVARDRAWPPPGRTLMDILLQGSESGDR